MNRLSRRKFLATTSVALVGVLAVACQPPTPTPAPPPTAVPAATAAPAPKVTGTITFMLQPGGTELELTNKYARKFEEAYPGTKVQVDQTPAAEFRTKLLTMFAAKTPPDCFWLYYDDVPGFVQNNLLISIDEWMARDNFPITDYAKVNIDMYTVSGKLYGIPRVGTTIVLFWSKKAFADAKLDPPDPSWTWEGKLLDAAKKLTVVSDDPAKRRFGFAIQVGSGLNWSVIPIVWAFGGDLVTQDATRVMVTDPATIRGYQWLADLINVHKVSPGPGSFAGLSFPQLVVEGRVAMYTSGRWDVVGLREATKKAELPSGFDVTVLPTGPAGRVTRTSTSGYGISKDGKNPEGGWELLKWWFLGGFIEELTSAGQLQPAYLPLLRSDTFLQPGQDPSNAKAFVDSLDFARPEHVFAKYPQLVSLVEAAMDPVYAGEQTAENALQSVKSKADELLT